MTMERTQGLNCPSCGGVVPVPEGARILQCPYCDQRSLVQGELGVRRWQVSRKISREGAAKSVEGFFSGLTKATDLKKEARIREVFLAYVPYWRVSAFVAGWMFGRVKSGDKKTKPVEVEVMEEMHWNDAAVDVSEFGVHRVSISKQDLEPYDAERLHNEAMVFEPSESRTDAMAEAEVHFFYRGRRKKKLRTKFFEKFHLLRPQLSLVYYPLWVARYEYRERNYQVVVDGVRGQVLYGKAPGNILYRAAALVAGMALGNLALVNGTLLAAQFLSDDADGEALAFLLLPIGIGLGLIVAGYRAFRYGEEVEEIQKGAKKAALTAEKGIRERFETGLGVIEELSELIE
jgi:predicted RNA-binding Zn-ribbon protein involved in translation (DUF1610 family)